MFRYSTELKLRDTDAAGIAFFAAYYAIAHDAYERFLSQSSRPLSSWLAEVHLPIVHSQAQYQAPLRLGEAFEVLITCVNMGTRSFTLSYEFIKKGELTPLAQLQTVHVAVGSASVQDALSPDSNASKAQAVPIPTEFKKLLSTLSKNNEES